MSSLFAFFFPPRTATLRRLPYLGWLFGLLFGLGLLLAITPDDVALALFLMALLLYYRAGALRARDAGLKARRYLLLSLAMFLIGFGLAWLRDFGADSMPFMKFGWGFQVIMTLLLLAAPSHQAVTKTA
ncbi:hypothetical protein ACKTG8_004069 [Cronobacter sakazakii]|uniref:hypothetical protein n=1 Tax=Cronobacter sakazakii TaxID=28141 RepID=UPI0006D136CF|nr:hypothetical protein [Cronobacter sakazakii]EGT5763380.1 hypothetical protein [Cronobacter sakazakii]EIX1615653.1 hypothetical protein [Cronobacter sakazakii]EJG0761337.1 hypothetical protein [Cronobacter sakazakii]ELY2493840.1 hypothetical protein [Cronobacter sakazakii]ELY2619214.1 hypothetical protein [Cronobacter sakazakii]